MKKTLISGLSSLLIPLGAYGAAIGGGYNHTSRAKPATASSEWMTRYRAEPQATPAPVEDAELQLQQGQRARELVIIDSAVEDKHVFYQHTRPGVDVLELGAEGDGLEQIKQALTAYANLEALHLVSHATDGELHLGGQRIDESRLRSEIDFFAALNGALKPQADLLFYGCDLASTKRGEAFLELVQAGTHLDLAASDNPTGNSESGSDWDLEIVKGEIETSRPFSKLALQSFSDVLAIDDAIGRAIDTTGFPNGYATTKSYDVDGSGYVFRVTTNSSSGSALYAGFGYIVTNFSGGEPSLNTITVDLAAGQAFDIDSLAMRSTTTRNYVFTPNVGSPVVLSVSNASFNTQTLNFTGITNFTISRQDGGDFEPSYIDSFFIKNASPAKDSDGNLIPSATITEPVAIPTTVDTVGEAVDVFDFTLSDGGTADGLAMGVSQVVLNVTGSASDTQRGQITWRLNGNDASNVTGVYNAGSDTITFSGLNISIADGASETYTVNAYYNDNTNLTEGLSYVLGVDGDTDLTVGGSGTQMGATSPVSNGTGSTVDVTATALAFTTQPATSVSGSALGTQPVVTAQDAFGNTDSDFTETITLTEASAGTLSNGSVAASGGVATFTNVTYTATADQQSFTLTANDDDGTGTNLPTVDANAVTSDVVATQAVFDSQPDPLTVPSGVATNFTTAPVVSARDANGVIDTDYVDNVQLFEANGAGSATMSVPGDVDGSAASVALPLSSGVADFAGMQITYTASGASDETFNLRANIPGITATNSAQLTGTVDSTPPTITAANIAISGGTGAAGAYIVGDTVTATWNNTAGGDNNDDVASVTVDFSQFGGGAAVAASNSGDTWTATFTITEDGGGSIDATNRNVSVTATDNASNADTVADTSNATVDNDSPVVTDGSISLSGASGTAGAFIVGDTVSATWNNTIGGDNNSDTISAVTVDFSQFGGGAAVAASNSAGTWTATYTITEAGGGSIEAGNRNVSVTATDNAGNTTTTADSSNATVDNVSPAATEVTPVTTPTSDTTPSVVFSSTQAGSLSVGGSCGSADEGAIGSGNTTITLTQPDNSTALADASYSDCTVTVVDDNGNSSDVLSLTAFTVDATPPVAPSTPDMNALSDSGTSNTDDITSDTTPTFSGTSEAGTTVALSSSVDGAVGSTTSDGSGNWSITATTLSEGAHNISATAEDGAGNTGAASSALAIIIDVTAPTAPSTPDLTAASDTGASDTDNLTSNSTPTFTGTSEANASVTLSSSVDGTLGSTTADGSGNWSITASTMSDASHNVTADSSDVAGNTGAASPALSVTIDTAGPAAPSAPDLEAGSDSGASSNDNITNATAPTLTGTAEANTEVSLSSDQDGNLGTVTADGSGNWSLTPGSALSENVHQITATATDTFGNQSPASPALSVTIDTSAPAEPPAADLAPGSDSGSSDTDDVTNATTPTLTGTVEANASITLNGSVDGNLGTTSADGAGNWSAVTSILSEGTQQITLTATDLAGNTGVASAALTVTVDTTPPGAAAAPDLNAASDSGTSNTDDLTNVVTPLITGTADANTEIELSSDQDGVLGTLTSDGSGNWNATPTLSENVHQLTATATDAAGNTGPASTALSITVDTTAPAAPGTPDLDAASDTGSSDTDNITSDTTPSFSGTAEGDAAIELQSDQDGVIGNASADGAGAWQITANALSLNTHAITAVATDVAGNQGPASASLSVEIDTDSPTLSISAPTPAETNTGPVSFTLTYANVDTVDLQPTDITPVFTGNAAGSVNVLNGTSMSPEVQITGLTGDGTVTITVAAGSGEDSAGNPTPETGPSNAATIDNTAPTVSFSAPNPASTATGPVSFPITIGDADSISLTVADVSLVSADGVTGDIAVNDGTTANPEVVISNIDGFGQLAIQLAAGIASDAATNDSAASAASPAATITDELPVFTASGPFTISETAADGTIVGDIDANDGNGGAPDEGISYSITAGNGGGGFAIDAASGEITVADNTALVFANDPAPVLTVQADDGAQTADASVTINLTEDSDSDSDGIPNSVEDAGPNNGDGNNDGTPDSQQDSVASFRSAPGNTYITVEALDCSTVSIGATDNPADDTGTLYPYGTVSLTVPCNSAEIAITVAEVGNANLPASRIRALRATGPVKLASDYIDVTTATRSDNVWLLSLSDAEAYDLNTTSPGIVFSGGPGVPVGSSVIAIPTIDWLGRLGLILLLGLSGIALLYRRR